MNSVKISRHLERSQEILPFGKSDGKTLDEWQQVGQDGCWVLADPLFADPQNRDFRLAPNSPALEIGFKPFDFTQAGVYGEPHWVALAKAAPMPAMTRAPLPTAEWYDVPSTSRQNRR